ncbi:hypothetical protein HYV10_04085 [Candidatus Dependentiae bacterium]|nr:hypothetical protein [Candidatus Dependentiae bacterium]
MNFKKLITLFNILTLITQSLLYSMTKKTSALILSTPNNVRNIAQTLRSIPLETTKSASTLPDYTATTSKAIVFDTPPNKALTIYTPPKKNIIPVTSSMRYYNLLNNPNFNNLLSPDDINRYSQEEDIGNIIENLKETGTNDLSWINRKLDILNKSFNTYIMSNVASVKNIFTSDIFFMKYYLSLKLKILQNLNLNFQQRNLITNINKYIQETETVLQKCKKIEDTFRSNILIVPFYSDEFRKTYSKIKSDSKSPQEFVENLYNFLDSPEYKFYTIMAERKLQDFKSFKTSNNENIDNNEQDYEPYQGLSEQFAKAVKQGALLTGTGLALEEYTRHKLAQKHLTQKKIQENKDKKSRMLDFTREK